MCPLIMFHLKGYLLIKVETANVKAGSNFEMERDRWSVSIVCRKTEKQVVSKSDPDSFNTKSGNRVITNK